MVSGVMGLAPFSQILLPHEMLAAEGEEQELGTTQFDLIIGIQRRGSVEGIAIEINNAIRITREQDSFALFGVKDDDRMVSPGYLVITQDLNVHIIRSAYKILPLDYLIVLTLPGAVNTNDPSAHWLDILTEQFFFDLHLCSLNRFLFLGGGLNVAVRTDGPMALFAEYMTILAVDQIRFRHF